MKLSEMDEMDEAKALKYERKPEQIANLVYGAKVRAIPSLFFLYSVLSSKLNSLV